MYTSRKKRPAGHRKYILLSALVVLVVVAAGGFAVWRHREAHDNTSSNSATRPVNSIDYSPSKPSDNVANNQRKSTPASSGITSGSTLNTPSTTPTFSVTVSYARKDTSQATSIDAAANVNGTTTGTCIFNFSQSQDGPSVVSSPSEPVQETNQSAACPPVTVTMPNAGNWYVSVSVTNNGSTATGQWAANPVALQ